MTKVREFTGVGAAASPGASGKTGVLIRDRLTTPGTGIDDVRRAGGVVTFTWSARARTRHEAERDVRVRVHDLVNIGQATSVDMIVVAGAN